MKKLIIKDKLARKNLELLEFKQFINSYLSKNLNFTALIRWNFLLNLRMTNSQYSRSSLSNRCQITVNKKRFNKRTFFSRNIYLKLVRSGEISGFKKSVW